MQLKDFRQFCRAETAAVVQHAGHTRTTDSLTVTDSDTHKLSRDVAVGAPTAVRSHTVVLDDNDNCDECSGSEAVCWPTFRVQRALHIDRGSSISCTMYSQLNIRCTVGTSVCRWRLVCLEAATA